MTKPILAARLKLYIKVREYVYPVMLTTATVISVEFRGLAQSG